MCSDEAGFITGHAMVIDGGADGGILDMLELAMVRLEDWCFGTIWDESCVENSCLCTRCISSLRFGLGPYLAFASTTAQRAAFGCSTLLAAGPRSIDEILSSLDRAIVARKRDPLLHYCN